MFGLNSGAKEFSYKELCDSHTDIDELTYVRAEEAEVLTDKASKSSAFTLNGDKN